MNLGEILARTMRNINFVYNDGDHIKNLINEALTMIAADAKIQTTHTITFVPGQSEYPLPINYKEVITMVEGPLSSPYCIFPLTEVDSYTSGFYIYNGNIVFRPMPNEGKTVTFYYYQYPDEMLSEDDVPDIDPRYHDVLATYAAAMVLSLPNIKDVNQTLIDRYFSVWEQRRAQFKVEMQRRNKQTSVRKVTNYD